MQALGSARIDQVDADTGTASLSNGDVVSMREMAEEIVADYPDGYAFQSVAEQHSELTKRVGPALATLRFVTVIEDNHPYSLYSVWKLPGENAMADNTWQPGSLMCGMNIESGAVESCILGSGPGQESVDTHPITGEQITGFEIPYFEESKKLVETAHSIFPVNSMLGWDVGITEDGPVLIECNHNPAHEFLQTVTGRPTLTPEMQATFDRVVKRTTRTIAGLKARLYTID